MNTKLVEIKPDRVVVQRTVLQALSVLFVDKRVSLPAITMHIRALEER
jgi:hypothetical protein